MSQRPYNFLWKRTGVEQNNASSVKKKVAITAACKFKYFNVSSVFSPIREILHHMAFELTLGVRRQCLSNTHVWMFSKIKSKLDLKKKDLKTKTKCRFKTG